MREFKYNFKVMILRKEFYLSLLMILLIPLIHFLIVIYSYMVSDFTIQNVYPAVYQTYILGNSINFGLLTIIIMPALCSLIYSDSAFMEKQYRVDIYLRTRLNPYKDWLAKSVLCFFTSFIVCLLSFLLNAFICYMVFDQGTYSDIFGSSVYEVISYPFLFMEKMRLVNVDLYLLLSASLIALYIAFYAELAMQISAYVKNRLYILFLVPFLMLAVEFVLSLGHLQNYSLMYQMQLPADFTILQFGVSVGVFLLMIIGLIIVRMGRIRYEMYL